MGYGTGRGDRNGNHALTRSGDGLFDCTRHVRSLGHGHGNLALVVADHDRDPETEAPASRHDPGHPPDIKQAMVKLRALALSPETVTVAWRRHILEHQASAARALSQSGDNTVVAVRSAVKADTGDTELAGPLGHPLPHPIGSASPVHGPGLGPAGQFTVGSAGHGNTGTIVDELSKETAVGAKYREARALGRAAHVHPGPPGPPLPAHACACALAHSHGQAPVVTAFLPALRRTTSPA